MQIKHVGIMGGAGYAGGELVRLLIHHEGTKLVAVQSRSQAGKPVASIHQDLLGETDLDFCASIYDSLPALDVLFLALPHGETAKVLAEGKIPDRVKIVDLSADFRLKSQSKYSNREFVYGLPERYRDVIKTAKSVANPGCFATGIQAALLPLASVGILERAYVTGLTGSTGAGISPSPTTHFSFRANNVQAYKTLTHQHMFEVEETLSSFAEAPIGPGTRMGESASPLNAKGKIKVNFVPLRGGFTRGIFVSAMVETKLSKIEAMRLYRDFYDGHPFCFVTDQPIDLKTVVNTNRMMIEVTHNEGTLAINVALDNLLKGASGQAVQNYNLMSGFPEAMGLRLKGMAF